MRRLATILSALLALAIGAEAGAVYVPPVPSGESVRQTDAPKLAKWRSALSKVTAGTGRARLLFIGDSKDLGSGAGTGTITGVASVLNAGAFTRAKPAWLGTLLTSRGIAVSRHSTFGAHGFPSIAAAQAYDVRESGAATWGGGVFSVGGNAFYTGDTSTRTFTPEGIIDTIVVFSIGHSGNGTFTVNVDGGATAATINQATLGQTLYASTVSVTRGTHAINLQRSTGGNVNIAGILAYDSTVPAVDIINAGVYGSTSATWVPTATAWTPLVALPVIAPNLTLIQLGANDNAGSMAISTYTANMQALITAAKLTGDVILEIPQFGNYGTDASRAPYRDALIDLGATNNCLVVDHYSRMGNYTAANALGWMADSVHETQPGYAEEARALVAPLAN